MPTLGSVSGNALASLTSIDKWIATLNSTVGGAARTGYKASKITFGGGTTMIEKFAQGGALGIQFAEQALTVGSTNVDFSEGQISASTEFTHMALNGSQNAFFMISDKPIPTSGDITAGTKFYYTRDGEFFLDDQRRLRTRDGLFVVGRRIDNAGATTGIMNIDTSSAQSGTGLVTLTIPNSVTDPEQYLNDVLEAHNTPPTDWSAIANQGGRSIFFHAYIKDLQALRFSKYGSTVFEQATPNIPAGSTLNPVDFFRDASNQSSLVRVSGNSLEASNVQLPSSLTELSLAQKIYAALTKVIQIDQQKLDNIMNLIR
ncbi:MAG: hypothetical protein KatS3mg068_1884 [Candidatus Sericytochromatia bacterium]|nr:MAG: hypothetical protein KatS3mg068_1884 [Candidatus Sericytochromatia bacterium]